MAQLVSAPEVVRKLMPLRLRQRVEHARHHHLLRIHFFFHPVLSSRPLAEGGGWWTEVVREDVRTVHANVGAEREVSNGVPEAARLPASERKGKVEG